MTQCTFSRWECLDNPSMPSHPDHKNVCGQWMTCLKLHGRLAHTLQTIKQIIKSRMGDQAPALPQLKPEGNAVGVATRDLPFCKNPFISDPGAYTHPHLHMCKCAWACLWTESWDCACHEQMVKKCNVPDLTSPKFTACYRSSSQNRKNLMLER